MPSKQLDQEGVLLKKLRRLKNEGSGYLSTLITRRNEIDALLLSSENVQHVKDKLPSFLVAFGAFWDANDAYLCNLRDEATVLKCQEQFDSVSLQTDDFFRKVERWIQSSEEILRLNSQISPKDSTRESQHSSRSGSHKSGSSSLSIARAKEAAHITELKAEAAAFKKRQSLEEQKFCLTQEQDR